MSVNRLQLSQSFREKADKLISPLEVPLTTPVDLQTSEEESLRRNLIHGKPAGLRVPALLHLHTSLMQNDLWLGPSLYLPGQNSLFCMTMISRGQRVYRIDSLVGWNLLKAEAQSKLDLALGAVPDSPICWKAGKLWGMSCATRSPWGHCKFSTDENVANAVATFGPDGSIVVLAAEDLQPCTELVVLARPVQG